MAEESKVAEGAGNFLSRKIGPLPAGVWLLGLLAAVYYVRRKQSAASAATAGGTVTPSGTVATTGGIGSSDQSGGGGSSGTPAASGSTTAGQYATNDAWARAAENYLVGIGVDPTSANSALQQFLASQSLTTEQQGDVNLAIQALGAPPSAPQPGTAPPPVVTPPGGVVYANNPPTGLSASNVGPSSVTLTWNKATNATSYTVSWNSGGGQQSLNVAGTDTTTQVAGLSPGTNYTFTVQAVPARAGDPSATTSATTSSQQSNPAPSPTPAPAPTPSGHEQPPQVATLEDGRSIRDWWRGHPTNDLNTLIRLNPNLGVDQRSHPGITQIKTSEARWIGG